MSTRQRRNSVLSRFWVPIMSLMLMSYFAYHAFEGRYGVHSAKAYDEQTIEKSFVLSRLQEERRALETKVNLLRDGSLEKDMVDQMVRYHLNLATSDEVVLFQK